MNRYLIRFGYMGTKYRGSQKQIGAENETVQDVIENALVTMLKLKNKPHTYFASRTDKGVHALMNALHVDLEHYKSGEVYMPHQMRMKLNSYLTENNHEIVIRNCLVVPSNFHARFNAKWRSYHYRIAVLKHGLTIPIRSHCHQGYLPPTEVNRCHLVSSQLNTSIVKHVADLYAGEHDFSTFTKQLAKRPGINTRKIVEECNFYETSYNGCIEDSQYSNIAMWEFYIKSKSFLYHQVRKLIGAAIGAGYGYLTLSEVQSMLDNPGPEKFSHCQMMPAGGLYLANVHYNQEDLSNWDSSTKETIDAENKNMIYNKL